MTSGRNDLDAMLKELGRTRRELIPDISRILEDSVQNRKER